MVHIFVGSLKEYLTFGSIKRVKETDVFHDCPIRLCPKLHLVASVAWICDSPCQYEPEGAGRAGPGSGTGGVYGH